MPWCAFRALLTSTCADRMVRLCGAMANCELCELHEYTQRYCQFAYPFRFTILDCDSCDTPMAVLGEHRTICSDDERVLMVEALSLVARIRYPGQNFVIDGTMRQIPDHCHIHARPVPIWATR